MERPEDDSLNIFIPDLDYFPPPFSPPFSLTPSHEPAQGTVGLTNHLAARFKDKKVLPVVGFPLLEYLEKNDITMTWHDKMVSVGWNNPGIEVGQGNLVESLLCGHVTVTVKDKVEFDLVRYITPASSNAYNALVFFGETEPKIKDFLADVGKWDDERKNRRSTALWVFDGGRWFTDVNVLGHDTTPEDLVLEEDTRKGIEKDVSSFFACKQRYDDFDVPWKRGLLFFGPSGNGKTLMIKALLRTVGVNRLYVKSTVGQHGPEPNIRHIFDKARALQPCLLVLEDLDSLLANSLSFFLNEVDGLQNNEGVLIVATSNHPERIDEAIIYRPSRFDVKYKFPLPTHGLRFEFIKKWIIKMKTVDSELPFVMEVDELAKELAKSTDYFSFAFLKELFVSALLVRAHMSDESHDLTGEKLMRQQVVRLKRQINQIPVKEKKRLGYEERRQEHRLNVLIMVVIFVVGLLAMVYVGNRMIHEFRSLRQ